MFIESEIENLGQCDARQTDLTNDNHLNVFHPSDVKKKKNNI